jgi:hypothetical protein
VYGVGSGEDLDLFQELWQRYNSFQRHWLGILALSVDLAKSRGQVSIQSTVSLFQGQDKSTTKSRIVEASPQRPVKFEKQRIIKKVFPANFGIISKVKHTPRGINNSVTAFRDTAHLSLPKMDNLVG